MQSARARPSSSPQTAHAVDTLNAVVQAAEAAAHTQIVGERRLFWCCVVVEEPFLSPGAGTIILAALFVGYAVDSGGLGEEFGVW